MVEAGTSSGRVNGHLHCRVRAALDAHFTANVTAVSRMRIRRQPDNQGAATEVHGLGTTSVGCQGWFVIDVGPGRWPVFRQRHGVRRDPAHRPGN